MKMLKIAIIAPFLLQLASCAGPDPATATLTWQESSAPFSVSTEGVIPAGHADLVITASFKTHKSDKYRHDPARHGTKDYRLLINIDGQVESLEGRLRDESHLQAKRCESGDGTRYIFRKRVRLKEGRHQVAVALPADGVVAHKEIVLADAREHTLIIEPVYGKSRKKGGYWGERNFQQGITGLRIKVI